MALSCLVPSSFCLSLDAQLPTVLLLPRQLGPVVSATASYEPEFNSVGSQPEASFAGVSGHGMSWHTLPLPLLHCDSHSAWEMGQQHLHVYKLGTCGSKHHTKCMRGAGDSDCPCIASLLGYIVLEM